jgi:HlyD family secretion protein
MFRMLANRRVLAVLAIVGGLLAVALWPVSLEVDVATVARGPLVVTVDEEGRTRVRDRFVISAPVSGRVLRIELEPGDVVTRGSAVVRIQPDMPPLLDARTRAEAQAAVEAAEAVLGRARAEEQRARAAHAQAARELERSRRLVAGGAMPAQDADVRADDVRLAAEAINAALFATRAAESELDRARVRLARPSWPAGTAAAVVVNAPADGVVLRRLRESESVVPAGEPLLEVGDPRQLEIVVDLLSTDAVRVARGARATVEEWGTDAVLDATVRRVEPAGFTKISALGVEEQRVNVILEPSDPAACAALGDAYRVDVRIVTWESTDVLKVPTSALFRDGEQWAVFAVREGRARRTRVEVGHQTAREAEVISGLTSGDQVIVHPGDLVQDGVRVKVLAPS